MRKKYVRPDMAVTVFNADADILTDSGSVITDSDEIED